MIQSALKQFTGAHTPQSCVVVNGLCPSVDTLGTARANEFMYKLVGRFPRICFMRSAPPLLSRFVITAIRCIIGVYSRQAQA